MLLPAAVIYDSLPMHILTGGRPVMCSAPASVLMGLSDLKTGGVKQASHLLKYDSTLGTFNADVKCACFLPCQVHSSRAVCIMSWPWT